MTDEEYKENKKIPGYSILSKLSSDVRSVKSILDGIEKKTKSLDFGSLLDIRLLTPNDFDNTFYILSNMPSTAFKALADEYIRLKEIYSESGANEDLFDRDSCILQARENIGFDARLKDATVIKQFIENCNDYVIELTNDRAKDKILVSTYDVTLCDTLIDMLKTNQFTSKYFNPTENIEVLTQLIIEFKDKEGRDIKCKLDMVYIDHNNKTITPIDVKTYSESFVANYYKFKYYYQAAIYSSGIIWYMLNVRPELADYKLNLFEFITINSCGKFPPLIYKIPSNHLETASFGGMLNNRTIKGWVELLNDFYWHLQEDRWEYSREVYTNGFKMIE